MVNLFFQKYKNSDHGVPSIVQYFPQLLFKDDFKDKFSKYIFWISSYTSQFQMKASFDSGIHLILELVK